MGIWDNHDAWMEQMRELMGDDLSERLDDDDMMFVSNLAVQAMRGDIGLPQVLHEIQKWVMGRQGIIPMLDEESFELEMAVNHPDLIEVTIGVKQNLMMAGEPGIADGILRIWAHPGFTEFVEESSTVAMTGKAWFEVWKLNESEHITLGWAIAQAVRDAAS